MERNVRVLHFEDNDNDAMLVGKTIETAVENSIIVRVATPAAYLDALGWAPFDLIISEYRLPGFGGIEALRMARQQMPDTAFLFVTGAIEDGLDTAARLLGASDCILKHQPSHLIPAIRRVLAESLLKRTAALLQRFQANILQTVTDAVIVVSAQKQISYWNDGAMNIFGLTRERVLGQSVSKLDALAKRSPFSTLICLAIKHGASTKEISCNNSVDQKIWVLAKATLMKADLESNVGCLLIVKDISARHLVEEERERANTELRKFDRFKSEFLATASHEMRTPLTIIREFTSLMADKLAGPVTQTQSECLLSVLRNCDRLTSLLNDLLDLAKIESGRMFLRRAEIDIAQLLRECAGDFVPHIDRKTQSIVLEIEDHLPLVLGDRSKIGQALVNLVGNANKFTPEGGKIVVRAFQQQERICIEISDNGQGIEDGDLAHICDAFVQASREDGPGARGTGLGLTITRQIIRLHDSDIVIKSQRGIGSTFGFSLPAHSVALEQAAFVLDHTRSVGDDKTRYTVIAVAVRRADGSVPDHDAVLRAKGSCDKAIKQAMGCDSITERGVFVYIVDAESGVVQAEIESLKASGIEQEVGLGIECEEIPFSSSIKDLEGARRRLSGCAA